MQCITLVNYGCYIIAITRMTVEVEMRGERREGAWKVPAFSS